MSLIKNSILTFSAKISQVVAVFLIGIIIARILGPHGNGIYELFQLVVVFSVTLGTFGVGHSMIYVVKRLGFDIRETFSTVSVFGIIWGTILGIIVFIFYSLFPSIISGLPSLTVILGAILIPFTLVDAYLIQGFLVELKIKKQSGLIILKNLFLILFIALTLWVFHLREEGIIYSVTLAYIISTILVFTSLKRTYHFPLTFNKKLFSQAFSFGIKSWLGNIFLILNYKLDMFLVNHYLSVQDVGLYSVAVMIATSLFLIPSSLGPLLYSSWSEKNIKEVDSSTPVMTRQILFIAFIVSICAIAISYFAIPLVYGAEFMPSFTALLYLLPGVIFMTANYVLFNNFASRGRPLLSAFSLIIALVVNIIFNIILIPKMGINGAAISSTFSYALSTLISMLVFYTIKTSEASKNILIITLSDIATFKRAIVSNFKK